MVDYLFPYVNQRDPIWQQEYRVACSKYGKVFNLEDVRFRDLGFLKYHFRSIAKYMSWIHKVYMIVSSETQIPNWINQDTVGIILHRDFIPKQYLPCFNSNRIEMFLPKLDFLQEKIIYANDDFYVMRPTHESDFYNGSRPKMYWVTKGRVKSDFQGVCKRSFDLVRNDYNVNLGLKASEYIRPPHNQVPLLKSVMKEVWLSHSDEMIRSIEGTPFRELASDYNQYIYSNAEISKGIVDKDVKIGKYFDLNDKNFIDVSNEIYAPERKLLCINDGGAQERNTELVTLAFEKKFPEKCKYEC